MSFTNTYTPPPVNSLSTDELYGPDPYDINFVYPLHFPSLETPRVKLTPFIPRIHADHFWSQIESNLDLFRYYPFAFATKHEFLTVLEDLRRNPDRVLLSVIDKTTPDGDHPEFGGGSFAGVVGLINSVPANLATEIGFVAVLPAFQRTHVASNAVGAALKYCLELPSAEFPGLGLRRVEWRAHARNLPSVRLAERMGFTREGTFRWHMALPPVLAKDAEKPREGDKWPEKYGRHTVILAVTWEDWENGVRSVAQKNVDRV